MFVQQKKNHSSYLLVALLFLIIIAFGAWLVWHDLLFNQNRTSQNPSSINNKVAISSRSLIGHNFIMSAKVLNEISANQAVFNRLKTDSIYVLISRKNPLTQQALKLDLILTADYTSEASLQAAISHHTISSSVKAILYDNEPWTYTPLVEQQNPLLYYQKAASLAHQNNYIFIATPVLKSKSDISFFTSIAKISNLIDIQSQYDQAVASIYAGHVIPLAKAIKAANSKVIILSGLSTNPAAGVPTVAQLINDAKAVDHYVSGYWLNVPALPAVCKISQTNSHNHYNGRCAGPQLPLAIKFLQNL